MRFWTILTWFERGEMKVKWAVWKSNDPTHGAAPVEVFWAGKHHVQHVARAMELAEAALDEREIPRENTVFYAFHRGMPASAKQSNTKRPWAALIPYIPPYGNRTTQRMQVFPRFITTSFQQARKSTPGSRQFNAAVRH